MVVLLSNHLILCCLLLLLPLIFPRTRIFSNELVLHVRWANYWSFSFSNNPSDEHSGLISFQFSSAQSWTDSLQPHGLQHTRLPCSLPTPGADSNSCPSNWWCHQTISPSVITFSSHLQTFPASGSFLMSQFLALGGHSIGVSALTSVLPMNTQD